MEIIDFFLHIDEHLATLIIFFGNWTYALLFGIIFAETGLIIAPFLPGDSLLFAVGALARIDLLNIYGVYFIMLFAAILGDSFNYFVGRKFGARLFYKENSRFFNKAHLLKTSEFYERHGGKTIILARFLPIVRTFAPFVAGIGKMRYDTFFYFNVVGAFIWVTLFTFTGYFFGGLPIVKKNFEYFIIGIIVLSIFPIIYEFVKNKLATHKKKQKEKIISVKDIEETFKKEDLVN